MSEGIITLSHTELDRTTVISQVAQRKITQRDAAHTLKLCTRQVKRLVKRWREGGPDALVSARRGKPPNNAFDPAVRSNALDIVRQQYPDFGPTLAAEKLATKHAITLNPETLRLWMIEADLWRPRQRRTPAIHPSRPRRPREGELVQIDGSPHDWFEERGPRCTLIVFIDDATGKLQALHFCLAETTQAYMQTLRDYMKRLGRPAALYSDKHSIFRVNHPEHEGELTQFSRALRDLEIEPIHANTPQAKGRVERANQTLQDRLVKEMRLEGIDDINAANAFLERYRISYNERFAKPAANPENAHRLVHHDERSLQRILCLQHQRKVTKNLSFSFKGEQYHIQSQGQGYGLRKASVTICEDFEGRISVWHKGRELEIKRFEQQGQQTAVLTDEKGVNAVVDQAMAKQSKRPTKPSKNHPWRRDNMGFHASPGDTSELEIRGHL